MRSYSKDYTYQQYHSVRASKSDIPLSHIPSSFCSSKKASRAAFTKGLLGGPDLVPGSGPFPGINSLPAVPYKAFFDVIYVKREYTSLMQIQFKIYEMKDNNLICIKNERFVILKFVFVPHNIKI